MQWEIRPNDVVRRTHLHDAYGGQRQGGIATPGHSVIIFTDPATGAQHDYHDEWIDGILHYAGEGQPQHGDQEMKRGNKAILEHRERGIPLRVFYGAKGNVIYAGEFELASDSEGPFYEVDVPREDGTTRSVIMFRLVPCGEVVVGAQGQARPAVKRTLSKPYVPATTVAASPKESLTVDSDAIDRGLAGHTDTQNALQAVVAAHGHPTNSPDGSDPNFDLAWRLPSGMVVVAEIKSLTPRNEAGQIRLGIGQVLDYAFQLRSDGYEVTAVLAVEQEPVLPHWTSLCQEVGVRLTWPAQFEELVASLQAS